MTRRLAATIGAVSVVAVLGIGAWAGGLIFADPSHTAWAATVCTASEPDPLDDGSWQASADRIAEAIAQLEDSELPDGTEEFHTVLLTSRERHRAQLQSFARTDPAGSLDRMLSDLQRVADTRPRGASIDEALGAFFATIASSDALVRTASRSLPAASRAAIEGVPGCAERLLS